ncbi:MAG: GntR family transcriptional regulator [Actinobacteria bacterium]|nr:GntR family transcriptional regulator [Actinomycetota bacterium]
MKMEQFEINRRAYNSSSFQVAEFLRKKVNNGDLKPGERLPSVREVVSNLNVGTRTVQQAFSMLQNEGIVEVARGRGVFVSLSRNTLPVKNDSPDLLTRQISIVSIAGATGNPERYHSLILAGIVKECERKNVIVQLLPSQFISNLRKGLAQYLIKSKSEGVVWLEPKNGDLPTIEALRKDGVPCVLTGRGRYLKKACVETDFEAAGFVAGRRFIDSDCEIVYLFSY